MDPNKLLEKVDEKRVALEKIMPDLQSLYQSKAHEEDVYVYRGLEGWKNYMRTILRVNEDVYTIGGNGAWTDPRLMNFLSSFLTQAKHHNISFHLLYDHVVKDQQSKVTTLFGSDYRFLPKKYSSMTAADIFGDYVVIVTVPKLNTVDDASLTVIVNRTIADGFRMWFKALWEISEK